MTVKKKHEDSPKNSQNIKNNYPKLLREEHLKLQEATLQKCIDFIKT